MDVVLNSIELLKNIDWKGGSFLNTAVLLVPQTEYK